VNSPAWRTDRCHLGLQNRARYQQGRTLW